MVMSADRYLVGSENILAEAGKLSHSLDDIKYFVTNSCINPSCDMFIIEWSSDIFKDIPRLERGWTS